jgi:hypothetical protein
MIYEEQWDIPHFINIEKTKIKLSMVVLISLLMILKGKHLKIKKHMLHSPFLYSDVTRFSLAQFFFWVGGGVLAHFGPITSITGLLQKSLVYKFSIVSGQRSKSVKTEHHVCS